MKINALIGERLGIEALAGTDPTAVFDEVADAFVRAGAAENSARTSLRQAFLDRERQGTTAFGFGMAIPHIFHAALQRIHVLVARHPSGVALGAHDGLPTQTLICVAGPESERELYLKLLGQIARTLRDRNWRKFIQQAPTTAVIFDILLEAAPE